MNKINIVLLVLLAPEIAGIILFLLKYPKPNFEPFMKNIYKQLKNRNIYDEYYHCYSKFEEIFTHYKEGERLNLDGLLFLLSKHKNYVLVYLE